MKIAVIGGGPAGIFAAISAKNSSNQVVLFERNKILGSKILLTGKGRCNLTNLSPIHDFISNVVTNSKFLYSAISKFSPSETYQFFEKNGLPLIVQRGNRVFPQTEKSLDVVKFLENCLIKSKIQIYYNFKVNTIEVLNGGFFVNNNYEDRYDKVIMATGGLSYPKTGSDGYGFHIVKNLGHSVSECRPGLVGIKTCTNKCFPTGLSLKNVKFVVTKKNKILFSELGELLFTHVGLSGPLVLKASSIINFKDIAKLDAYIDLKPGLTVDALDRRVLKDFNRNSNKLLKNSLDALLPKKLIPYFITRSEIEPEKPVNQLTKEERARLVSLLKHLDFKLISLEEIDKAIITSGGVDVKNINSRTMESKIIPDLFFAGEMIDVNAYTGGYNMQIAMSTGFLAGTSAKNKN